MTAIESTTFFSGRVQGVGFRWTTLRALEGLGLDGYVKNLVDGRVELRLQGERELVAEAVRRVEAAMSGYIETRDTIEGEIAQPLGPFRVR